MLLSLLLACTGSAPVDSASDTSEDVPTGPGTLAFTFRMDDDYLPEMEAAGQPPVGTFGGSIFAEADASSVGPNEGASALATFSVPGVDLTSDGGPTDVLFTTEPLDAQIVWVLGCLDVDVPADGCGDVGDPITIPNENKVQVVAGADTPFEVYMGMLRP